MDKTRNKDNTLIQCESCGWRGKGQDTIVHFIDLELNPAFGGIPTNDDTAYCPNCDSPKIAIYSWGE